ncbi:hypothetical protein R80B4_00281 [Fibrobacteres bacterium R8-0-B4]
MSLEEFVNQYSLSKTLRFELRPIGKTEEHIRAKGLLSQDELRAKEYKMVKEIMDRYHKQFIENSLEEFSFSDGLLNEYVNLAKITNKDDTQKKEFENTLKKLRKEIVKAFDTKRLFGKELIQEDLPEFLTDTEEKELVGHFYKWTTYFTGFNENRENMYSDEEKSTAISYRLINNNLPKFVVNISVFEKVKDILQDKFDTLKTELNLHEDVDKYFCLDSYNKFLTQSGIEMFNHVIGGKSLEDKTKIKGLNEYINLHNQKQSNKSDKLPKFTPLFKMILSDRITLSWLPEQFNDDTEVLEAVRQFYIALNEKHEDNQSVFERLKKVLQEIKDNFYDLNRIYLRNDTSLTNVSQKNFGHWDEIKKSIEAKYESKNPKSRSKTQEKYDEEKERYFKRFDSVSLGFINECSGKNIERYFAELGEEKDSDGKVVKEDCFKIISERYKKIECLLNTDYPSAKKLSQDKDSVAQIKDFLDALMDLFHFVKPLCGKGNETNKDEKFYGEFLSLIEELKKVTKLYDKVRNYMTKKPYSIEKIKLNFENSTLCKGWDKNKEQDNTTVLLRKNNNYYLAIMNYNSKTKFDNAEIAKNDESFYEKVDYKFLPDPKKMLPKVFLSEKGKAEFSPSAEILKNYERGSHKKGDTFNKNEMHQLIDFFKDSIAKHKDWKFFGFDFSETSSYESIDKFYNEVLEQGYKITFRRISERYINNLVDEGHLYLFQIYNKDFSEKSKGKGTPNLHTLYWKELFSEENLKDVVYKLNGEAKVFYRKKSLDYNDEILQKGHHREKLNGKFKYPIIKDKRFACDKFQFHCPITLNFKARGNEYINEKVNNFIKQNGIKHIIGIDRGERHLLYVSIIDLNGKIVKQFSLNEIVNDYNGEEYKKNYHDLLASKEDERTKQRQEWRTIENIKELKAGYLSQVVHKISKLVDEYCAIVVLEDLNFGFIRGRQKVEKSVYQQFEKALIDKMNYLVFKNRPKNEIGGVLKALQLTNKFESFQKIGKQSGFLFYVPAYYTSKMCPIIGFVNLFDCRYESVDSAKKFFEKFVDIRYNKDKEYFEFEVKNYTQFNSKAEGTRQNWVICTNEVRIKTFRNEAKSNKWDNEEIVLTEEFKRLFDEYKIDFCDGLKAKIIGQTEKAFFERLLHLFKMTVQMRNTNSNVDYMISPVADKNGIFFDSRNANENLPENADANGAYNIARKGLWTIKQIQKAENMKKINLAISNKEWLQFIQD